MDHSLSWAKILIAALLYLEKNEQKVKNKLGLQRCCRDAPVPGWSPWGTAGSQILQEKGEGLHSSSH